MPYWYIGNTLTGKWEFTLSGNSPVNRDLQRCSSQVEWPTRLRLCAAWARATRLRPRPPALAWASWPEEMRPCPEAFVSQGRVGCRQVTQNFKGSFSAVSKTILAIKMCCSEFFEIFKLGSLLYRSQLNMHSFLLPFRLTSSAEGGKGCKIG